MPFYTDEPEPPTRTPSQVTPEAPPQTEAPPSGGGLLGNLGGMLSSIMPFLLGILGIWFAIKKFMPDSGIAKMLPDLPSSFGGAESKPPAPDVSAGKNPVDFDKLLTQYADKDGNGKIDAPENEALKQKLGSVLKDDHAALSDNELLMMKKLMKDHPNVVNPILTDTLQGGQLTDQNLGLIAPKLKNALGVGGF